MASNTAVQLNMPARRLERAVRPRPADKVIAKAKSSNNVKAILLVLLAATICFIICARYVEIYNKSSEIEQAKKQLQTLNAQNEQIQMAISQEIDKTTLSIYAKNTLGMITPQKNQYVYLNLTSQDVSVNNKINSNQPSILSKAYHRIIDYFK